VWVYDLKTLAILDVNDSAVRNYGYSREEFLSLTIKGIRPQEDVPALLESAAKAPPSTETVGVWKHRKKNGTLIDVEITSHPLVYDGRDARLVVATDITTRKKAEAALRQSEERTRLVIETAYDPFIGMDAEGLIGEWNHQAEVTFGWSREEAIGKVLAELIVPAKYREAHKQGLKHFLATGEGPVLNKRIEITALHRDGHEFPVELTISPIRMGQTYIFNAFVQDITERKRAEEALRQSEQRYHLLFDSNPHPVWVCDWKTFAFLDVNDSAVRNYGYSRDEFLSLTIKDIRPPEEVPALLESFAKAPPNTEIAGIRKHRKKNGTLIDVEISSHPLVYAGTDARLVVATDITTRKKAEAALRQSEERFRSLVEGVQDYAIFMLDSKGFVASWNSGAEHIKGYKAAEIVGKHFSCFYSSEDLQTGKPQNELEAATKEGRLVDEGWRVRKDASRFWANVVITALRDTQGNLVGFSKITRDLTAHKQAEELIMHAKEEAERGSKFKDQFLSTMSHELRTPLNAVLGFSDLLADERYGPLNDRQQRYVSHIHTGGKHLLKLISDILDLSKIEAGRMELAREDVTVALAFAEVISALYPLAEKKSQALLQQVDPNLRVHADAMRFKQVLMNLIGNAIKFTPDGGRIELAARKVDDQVKIEVRDNGPGIPPEQQQRIFEAFFRLTETGSATEGTGLGLAITARLVELHGSKLEIESKPSEGTCFYFFLPLIASTLDQPIQASIPVPRAGKAPRILVIEDNAAIGQLIQSQLASSGYETLRCDQPERATEMAAEHQPDAITLDLLMKPVHGLEVLLQLKNDSRTSKIPVIVVTIVDQPGLGTALGADEYLIKPVDKATLLAAVERCLRSRGGAAPTRTILVVEDDVSTLEMIVELLEAYGYAVSTAADGEQARISVAQSLPELVILDLVLPKMSGFELLAEWRSNPRTADLSVFVLTSKDLTKEEEKYLHTHAESLFRKQNSWREPLIKQLERVVTSPSLENA
jgi:PAS domain S-box-containing protein